MKIVEQQFFISFVIQYNTRAQQKSIYTSDFSIYTLLPTLLLLYIYFVTLFWLYIITYYFTLLYNKRIEIYFVIIQHQIVYKYTWKTTNFQFSFINENCLLSIIFRRENNRILLDTAQIAWQLKWIKIPVGFLMKLLQTVRKIILLCFCKHMNEKFLMLHFHCYTNFDKKNSKNVSMLKGTR